MKAFPTIHLNGSHGPTLQEEYEEALMKLDDFSGAFTVIDFNARDYYLVLGSWEQARKDREAQQQHIAGLRKYLEEHIESINAQNKARERKP